RGDGQATIKTSRPETSRCTYKLNPGLGSAYPPNNKTVTADELSDRPLIAKISQYTDNSYIGIAGLKGGFGDIAASLDTLTQNTVRTGDDIQGLLDQAESSISGYLDEYAE
ncbi:hypothetical protein PMN44_10015, partial [Bifidobacterium longum]|nr:hypothetical protein [Bifidobacterium longum]MDB6546528.1 hypothetical protein [Bifidobacterium longum]MDB6548643.1 hypothetical protein [Bifidobacterium longum]MDB6552960.1 hypothetical protein [Bifidobacterium longum]MDB6555035.1 hypothetical protein [Bifidobacterium longum]